MSHSIAIFLFSDDKNNRTSGSHVTGMVQPIIDYGCVIWGSCGQSLLMNVHIIMKQYARIILNVKEKRQVLTVTLFCNIGWLRIDIRIRYIYIYVCMYVCIYINIYLIVNCGFY